MQYTLGKKKRKQEKYVGKPQDILTKLYSLAEDKKAGKHGIGRLAVYNAGKPETGLLAYCLRSLRRSCSQAYTNPKPQCSILTYLLPIIL